MATYVSGGLQAFNALAYSSPTERDISFFEKSRELFVNNVMPSVSGFYKQLVDDLQVVDYRKINHYVKGVYKKMSSFWEDDFAITALTTLEDIQFASETMIRWVMANPNVRELYHQNLCAGYDDKYTDIEPGKKGDDHHDYRMVMHGMEQWSEDEEEIYFVNYCETFDDPELSVDYLDMSDRTNIIQTWINTDAILSKMKEDPTSQYSGML